MAIPSQLFTDDVVLLAFSNSNLKLTMGQFAAKSEAAGMKISTSKSEATVQKRERVDCPLPVVEELLPQVGGVPKYFWSLFTCELNIDSWIGFESDADTRPVHCDKERAEPEGKALDLPFCLFSSPHIWSQALSSGRK